jgi:hypothetical protein
LLPSVVASELEQVAADAIRSAFHPTTPGFRFNRLLPVTPLPSNGDRRVPQNPTAAHRQEWNYCYSSSMERHGARFSFKEALKQLPRGCPLGLQLLASHGITAKRASALVRSGWLQRLGRGAYQLSGDTLNRDACLAFLAQQLLGGHVAAKTALAWHGVRHNLAYRETVVLWGDQPARLPGWLVGSVTVRYRVAHIFDPDLPSGLALAPLAGGHPELPVSSPERALLELLSETGSFESLEEVRQLVESTRNLRLPVLDQLFGHLKRIKVARLAAQLATDLQLPWAELAQNHSRRLGGGRRWVAVGRTGERLDLAATP